LEEKLAQGAPQQLVTIRLKDKVVAHPAPQQLGKFIGLELQVLKDAR
jgi:hypothetical protein